MKTEKVTCIMCPRGCKVKVELEEENDEIKEITAYACENGKEYAIEEIKSPNRPVMTVVECEDCDMPTVSVITKEPVPKDKIYEVMKELSNLKVQSPVEIGDVVKENVADTGVDIVVTRPG